MSGKNRTHDSLIIKKQHFKKHGWIYFALLMSYSRKVGAMDLANTHFTDLKFCPFRHLAGEVAKEWQEVEENDKTQQETLLKLVKEIVPYNMAHNAEHEACDLLMEIERLDMLEDYIDENAYGKVCLYLTR